MAETSPGVTPGGCPRLHSRFTWNDLPPSHGFPTVTHRDRLWAVLVSPLPGLTIARRNRGTRTRADVPYPRAYSAGLHLRDIDDQTEDRDGSLVASIDAPITGRGHVCLCRGAAA